MEGGWNDPIAVNLAASQKHIVGSFSVVDITSHFHLQVTNLTLEVDLPQQLGPARIKPKDGWH